MNYQKKPITSLLRSNQSVFTFKDIALIWGDTDRKATIAGVIYYVKTGALYRIRRGIYAKDPKYDRLELATRIYTPAYVSFETVLGAAGVTFQHYSQIFVASYTTREIVADGQTYSFRNIPEAVLTNPSGLEVRENYAIATAERAFLDIVYTNKDYHFDNLTPLDWDKVMAILPIYGGNKRMQKQVNQYKKQSHDA